MATKCFGFAPQSVWGGRSLATTTIFGLIVALSGLIGSILPAHGTTPPEVVFTFDFESGAAEWLGGFADYPAGEEVFYELAWEWRALPSPLSGHAFFMTGNNHSDDLFMFLKRRISGLKPSTFYQLTFQIDLASNAPSGCAGVGGPPGEAVGIKAGATQLEPIPVRYNGTDYRLNIDKGNQSVGGRDAIVLGTIANGQTDCLNPVYTRIVRENTTMPFLALSDQSGTLWILIGTDSGFEATTSIYYDHIVIRALEMNTAHSHLPLIRR